TGGLQETGFRFRAGWLFPQTWSTFVYTLTQLESIGGAAPAMTVFLVALVPALMVLYYYYNRDRHPEPWYCIALVFSLGGLSVFAILPLEEWALVYLPTPHPERGSVLFAGCMLIPGLIEETAKLLVLLSAIYWQRDFDEPVDGLIYATA